ncbi:hypothetical protein [Paraburkholderia sp. J10-1]|uniref:hypothetical protein n=1 Tax=Paraburkholderia sp. J10-1 TaxID=2805430 RepID=UPI002AB72ECD|nr:hypothetical protein [Paraburkholderia sp. J10-1]
MRVPATRAKRLGLTTLTQRELARVEWHRRKMAASASTLSAPAVEAVALAGRVREEELARQRADTIDLKRRASGDFDDDE